MRAVQAGKKLIRICCAVLLMVGLFPAYVHADEPSVMDALKNPSAVQQPDGGAATTHDTGGIAVNQPKSGWIILLQVLFSLGLVILLIYLLLRFLANRQLGLGENGPMRIVSSLPLGNGKLVQLVMIGDSLYVLGIGENVQLIRHIPPGDEMDLLLAEAEIKSTARILPSWLPFLRSNKAEEDFSDTLLSQQDEKHSFSELLERHWVEVNHEGTGNPDVWSDGGKRGGRT
jgi:flagellar protein FliO/FliZ